MIEVSSWTASLLRGIPASLTLAVVFAAVAVLLPKETHDAIGAAGVLALVFLTMRAARIRFIGGQDSVVVRNLLATVEVPLDDVVGSTVDSVAVAGPGAPPSCIALVVRGRSKPLRIETTMTFSSRAIRTEGEPGTNFTEVLQWLDQRGIPRDHWLG